MEWIDAREQLPNDDTLMLVFWVKMANPRVNYITLAWYDGEKWQEDDNPDPENNPDGCMITHWMRLPENPKRYTD